MAIGLTLLHPKPDLNVEQGHVHPHSIEVLVRARKRFDPDRDRVADEVRGDLNAQKTLKRWLLGGLGGDPEALKNQMPTLACLVCVISSADESLRIELTGPSGSVWFDRAALESIGGAVKSTTEDPEPARACYRFSAKVWRTRPNVSIRDSGSVLRAFRKDFASSVELLTYQRLGK